MIRNACRQLPISFLLPCNNPKNTPRIDLSGFWKHSREQLFPCGLINNILNKSEPIGCGVINGLPANKIDIYKNNNAVITSESKINFPQAECQKYQQPTLPI